MERTTPTLSDLQHARQLQRATLDRLAYLRGPRPPAPAVQRRMLRTLYGDALAVLAVLDRERGAA